MKNSEKLAYILANSIIEKTKHTQILSFSIHFDPSTIKYKRWGLYVIVYVYNDNRIYGEAIDWPMDLTDSDIDNIRCYTEAELNYYMKTGKRLTNNRESNLFQQELSINI